MKLTVKEQERLIMFNVAEVSRRRWKRGVKLNYIEAMSIICDELLERAREGRDSIYDLVDNHGRRRHGRDSGDAACNTAGSDVP